MISKNEKTLFEFRYLILIAACFFTCFFNVYKGWTEKVKYPGQLIFILGLIFVMFAYFVTFWNTGEFSERHIIFMVFAIGFVFRLAYVQSTGHTIRQHDVGGTNGHLAVIEHYFNGNGLPDTDVRNMWQFYQPPFWHFLCALWLKLQTFFGIEYKAALENLQHLSLFFSSLIMIVSHKLFRLFNLEKWPLVIACSIVAFHPTFIILSGSINNDVMSLAFALISLVLTIKWYREPNYKNIILLALSLGISMGTKLSGGFIALGIAILFLVRLLEGDIKDKLPLFGQFASFGLICVPLALWWQNYNLFKFGVPLTYVPHLSNKSNQYIGFRSVFERLFDFSSVGEIGVYPARVTRDYPFFEYNIPLGAMKSSVFGEYYMGRGTGLEIFAKILFYSATILAVLSVICSVAVVVYAILKKNKEEKIDVCEYAFPLICGVTLIASYIKFCFDYAHFCTMDFRYIALTVILGCLYLGLFSKIISENNKILGKIVKILFLALIVLMSISSVALYGTIG